MQIAACHGLAKLLLWFKKIWTTTLALALVYLHDSCDPLQKESTRLKSKHSRLQQALKRVEWPSSAPKTKPQTVRVRRIINVRLWKKYIQFKIGAPTIHTAKVTQLLSCSMKVVIWTPWRHDSCTTGKKGIWVCLKMACVPTGCSNWENYNKP